MCTVHTEDKALYVSSNIFDSFCCFFPENESLWSGPYIFIFAADTQPGLIDVFSGGKGKHQLICKHHYTFQISM